MSSSPTESQAGQGGLFDLSCIDTTPGANGLFSPPDGFDGDGDDYIKFLRERYRNKRYSQLFALQKHFFEKGIKITFNGPFSDQAKSALIKMS